MYIYKIQNMINNKLYIGKANNFKARKQAHFNINNLKKEPNKVLYKAMHKYGFENFKMDIVEICDDNNWKEREKYWIKKLNTIIPNGYNMIEGGSEPPHYTGEKSPVSKLSDKEVTEIQELLINKSHRELSNIDIAKRYNISVDQIQRINNGTRGYNIELIYPLRKNSIEDNVDEIIKLLSSWKYTCQEIADMYNVSKSCIKEINRGKNHCKKGIKYPIKPPHLAIGADKETYKLALRLLKNKDINYKTITEKTGIGLKALKSLEQGKYIEYLE